MFNTIDYKEIGHRIRLRRKELGITLLELASEVDLAASTIQRYEKGCFEKIKMPVIEAIAEALHVNPEWLIGETDDPTDYEDGDLIASIPSSYIELFDGNVSKAYQYMKLVDAGNQNIYKKIETEPEIKNPDIRMIARAGHKMTPEQAENIRKYAQYMYPEAFEE